MTKLTRMELHRPIREKGTMKGFAKKLNGKNAKLIKDFGKGTTIAFVAAGALTFSGVTTLASEQTPTKQVNTQATYTVKPGDNLFRIAQKYHTSVDTLTALNHISNANAIGAGQVIKLPTGTTATSTKSVVTNQKTESVNITTASNTYKVVKGDTFNSIATKHHLLVKELRALNPKISDPSSIYIGQQIVVSGTAFSTKPVERPIQTTKQEVKEMQGLVVGLEDQNHIQLEVEGSYINFYADGDAAIQKEIAQYKENTDLVIRYVRTAAGQNKIIDIVKVFDPQTGDQTVRIEGDFYERTSNTVSIYVNNRLTTYKISDYLANRSLDLGAGSKVLLTGTKTSSGTTIENIDEL